MLPSDESRFADIETIAKSLNVEDWDVALIGDGAGLTWDKPGGWACTLIDRHAATVATDGTIHEARKLFSGGMNVTSIEITELFPYVHAMLWYDKHHGKNRRRVLGRDFLNVLIITDNAATSSHGNSVQLNASRAKEICKHQPLWATMMHFARRGYRFNWQHRHRNTVALNSLADRLADASTHAAANALTQAMAHIHSDDLGVIDEAELIYCFNTAAFGKFEPTTNIVNPLKRRTYKKLEAPDTGNI